MMEAQQGRSTSSAHHPIDVLIFGFLTSCQPRWDKGSTLQPHPPRWFAYTHPSCSLRMAIGLFTLQNLPNGTVYYPRYACVIYSPGHMLRYCTPAMVCSKWAAMLQIRMRCAAIESSTCSIFCPRCGDISAIHGPIFKRFSSY